MEPTTSPPDRCPVCHEPCDGWHYHGVQHWPITGDEQDVWSSYCCHGTVNVPRPEVEAVELVGVED